MATIRQKKLAKEIVDNMASNKPKSAGQMLETVGYAKNTAEAKPGEIISQKGVQEELISLGFSEENAKRVVGEILLGGENDHVKLKAAEIVFKVQGSFAPEKHISIVKKIVSVDE